MRVRAKLIIRNAIMLEARERLGFSQQRVAELADVSIRYVADFEQLNFKRALKERTQMAIERIADVLEISPEEMVPEKFHGEVFVTKIVKEADVDSGKLLQATNTLQLPFSDTVAKEELREALASAFKSLQGRRKEIIGYRFGFTDGKIYTHEEIGNKLGITRTRSQQLEQEALQSFKKHKGVVEGFYPAEEHEEIVKKFLIKDVFRNISPKMRAKLISMGLRTLGGLSECGVGYLKQVFTDDEIVKLDVFLAEYGLRFRGLKKNG